MRTFLLLTIIYSTSLFAEDCPTPLPLDGQEVLNFAQTNCLKDDYNKKNVSQFLAKPKNVKKFCQGCTNHMMKLTLSSPEEQKKSIELYSEAALGELHKELSLITVDLMKMRSSFTLPFDAELTKSSCTFEKLEMPRCLKGKEGSPLFNEFIKQRKNSQNIMATELANILSPSPNSEDGLFKRTEKNSCGLKDNQVFYTQMRYYESLITPDLIAQLKTVEFNNAQNFKEGLDKAIDAKKIQFTDIRGTISFLSSHPMMNSLFQSPLELASFLTSIDKNDDNAKIIQKLYQSKHAKTFADDFSNRCKVAMSKTTTIMEKIYCETQKPFIADDAATMALINTKEFSNQEDQEAENTLQRHCAVLNNQLEKSSDYTRFSEVLTINSKNDPALFTMPIKNFKVNAFNKMIGHDGEGLCEAKKDKSFCNTRPNYSTCQMLQIHEQTLHNKSYQEFANSSDPKINDILRGFIGAGLPQKNGTTDLAAIKVLQDEGILPGGTTPVKTSTVRDAGAFYNSISNSTMKPSQNSGPSTKLATGTSPSTVQPKSEYSASAGPLNSDQLNPSPSIKDPTGSSSATGKFSNLSDDEQKKVMNYFKNTKGKTVSTPAGIEPDAKEVKKTNFADAAQISPNADESLTPNSPLVGNGYPIGVSPSMARATALTPEKKLKTNESLNKALLNANINREPASIDSEMAPTFMMSKSRDGLNEIDIKVAEEELKKINSFKETLKDLLAAHGQELAVVEQGEKIIIKLNNFEIVVSFNKELKIYEASSKNSSLPSDYLKTITNYFNSNLKSTPGKRDSLIKTFKISQNQKTP